MSHIKFKYYVLLMLMAGLTGLKAQIAVSSSGGNALGNGGSVSYSVGLVTYTVNSGTIGSLTQGVQQPFEITTITGLEDANGISLTGSVYPNPTSDIVKLFVDITSLQSIQSMYYQLHDINGKLIDTGKLVESMTDIVISKLIPATYFLKISQKNKVLKTFKITKN